MSCIPCGNTVEGQFCCFVVLDDLAELDISMDRPILPAVVQECINFNDTTLAGTITGTCDVQCGNTTVNVPACSCEVDAKEFSGCVTVQVAVPITGKGKNGDSSEDLEQIDVLNCEVESYVCCTNKVCFEATPICVQCPELDNLTEPSVCYKLKDFDAILVEDEAQDCPKSVYKVTGTVEVEFSFPALG